MLNTGVITVSYIIATILFILALGGLSGQAGVTVLMRYTLRLLTLQQAYEDHFAELSRVREHELQQLLTLVTTDRASLPGDLVVGLDAAADAARQELAAKEQALAEQRASAD